MTLHIADDLAASRGEWLQAAAWQRSASAAILRAPSDRDFSPSLERAYAFLAGDTSSLTAGGRVALACLALPTRSGLLRAMRDTISRTAANCGESATETVSALVLVLATAFPTLGMTQARVLAEVALAKAQG